MRVVALMTVRNEELYIGRCIQHLVEQGVEICLIDNDSKDRTREIAEAYLGKGVLRIERIPFDGSFELARILQNEERLAREIPADWFMHHDADEIREPPPGYRTLVDAVSDADRQGYNAINFDEYVFVPTRDDDGFEGTDYVSGMRYYYFFEPKPLRRVNLWKNSGQTIDLISSGGHSVAFTGRKVFPRNFAMRHYIILSRQHAIRKFGGRKYPEQELARGWHRARAVFSEIGLRFPDRSEMISLDAGPSWNNRFPKTVHLIFEDRRSWPGRLRSWLRRNFHAVTQYGAGRARQ
jgi:glycosyltransferase involved in cell wall biosynthesis